MPIKFPGETEAYRAARDELLRAEIELRRQTEAVAALRRAMPLGGAMAEDYVFDEAASGSDDLDAAQHVRFSELFRPGVDTLAVYSFMFGPERPRPCPGCAHFLDGLDGAVPHILQRIAFVVVAKSPVQRLLDVARERGWRHLRLLSTAGNAYDRDYFGDSTALAPKMRRQQEFTDGEEWDMPILNVFRRDGKTVRHFWGSELLYVPPEPGQEYRHNDLLDPLWNALDVTPAGRGDFHPKLQY